MRLNKKNRVGFVGPVSCVALLALVALSMACPETLGAHAEDNTTGNNCESVTVGADTFCGEVADPQAANAVDQNGDFGFTVVKGAEEAESNEVEGGFGFVVDKMSASTAENQDFDVQFNVKEYIQITAENDQIDVDVAVDAPTEGGTFVSGSTNFNVQANNNSGFSVYVYAKDEASRNLTSQDVANNASIKPISGAVAAGNVQTTAFAANSWGYDVTAVTQSAQEYVPIQTAVNSSPAFSSSKAAGLDLKLTCGTKVDTSLPADTYSTSVTVSAVAPPNVLVSLNNN